MLSNIFSPYFSSFQLFHKFIVSIVNLFLVDSPNVAAAKSPAGQEINSTQSPAAFVQIQQPQQANSSEAYAYQQNDRFAQNDDYHLSQSQQSQKPQYIQQQRPNNYEQQQPSYHRSLEELAEIAQLSQQQQHYSQIQRQQQHSSFPIAGKFLMILER